MSLEDLIRQVKGGDSLCAELDLFLKRLESRPSNRSVGWHPSEFVDMCARSSAISSALALVEEGDPIDPKLRRIFDTGTSLHGWYQNEYLGPMGILWGGWKCSRCHAVQWGFMPKGRHNCAGAETTPACVKLCAYGVQPGTNLIDARGGCLHCGIWGSWEFVEIPVKFRWSCGSEEHVITGSSDGLILLGGDWYVWEGKTINVRGFNMLAESKSWHRRQAMIYGHLIRGGHVDVPEGVRVPRPSHGMVFYIGKNDGDLKEFKFEFDDAINVEAEALVQAPVEFVRALVEKKLPEKHSECPSMFSVRSKACSNASYCWGSKSYVELLQLRKK